MKEPESREDRFYLSPKRKIIANLQSSHNNSLGQWLVCEWPRDPIVAMGWKWQATEMRFRESLCFTGHKVKFNCHGALVYFPFLFILPGTWTWWLEMQLSWGDKHEESQCAKTDREFFSSKNQKDHWSLMALFSTYKQLFGRWLLNFLLHGK